MRNLMKPQHSFVDVAEELEREITRGRIRLSDRDNSLRLSSGRIAIVDSGLLVLRSPNGPPLASVPKGEDEPVRQDVIAQLGTLVVGRGISLKGMIQGSNYLIIEGSLESSLVKGAKVVIGRGGIFKGAIEAEDADVAGTTDGTVTAHGTLIVRATGRLIGTARCSRLQVEDGGQIVGRIEMLATGPASMINASVPIETT